MKNLEDLIIEAGYLRVVITMRGLAPTVKTLAFIKTENPNGQPLDTMTNKSANQELVKKLRAMNLGFKEIKEHEEDLENVFFIPNITREEALQLGKEISQESIVFGEKLKETKDGKSYDGMAFSLLYTDDKLGQVEAQRGVFINNDNAEDYYTKLKGPKFQIPFFDSDDVGTQFEPSNGVVSKQGLSESLLKEIEFHCERILEINRTGKSRWINRGSLLRLLKDAI